MMSFRIARFRNNEGRVRVSDANDQVVAASQGRERVLQMPAVKRLEAAMNHAITCPACPLYSRFLFASLLREREERNLAQRGRSIRISVLHIGSGGITIRARASLFPLYGNRCRHRLRFHGRRRDSLLHFKHQPPG